MQEMPQEEMPAKALCNPHGGAVLFSGDVQHRGRANMSMKMRAFLYIVLFKGKIDGNLVRQY